ncbi:MAG TPA: diacylglycerol kinase family protein, partial [Prosthecobacter sp.]|nr:diacylglycerol kinase family protein [Prosthecobacter sp.]
MPAWTARFLRGFRHAFDGIAWALLCQRNMRFHAAATLAVTGLGMVWNLELWKWCVLCLCAGLVWTAEIFNTAIELLCDLVQPERDERVRRIKDTAAGAVLAAAIA